MNIQNVTITGPAAGFQLCVHLPAMSLYGIFFNGAGGGSVTNVTVDHIFQVSEPRIRFLQDGQGYPGGRLGHCHDYQYGGQELSKERVRSTRVDDHEPVSGSTAGPPHPLNGFSAQTPCRIVGASGHDRQQHDYRQRQRAAWPGR